MLLILKFEFIGRVSAKLQNFLLDNLPELEAEKKPEFKLGVKDIKLGARIFRKTNIPCICDKYVLELIRGVHKHFDLLTRFPEVVSFFISCYYKTKI